MKEELEQEGYYIYREVVDEVNLHYFSVFADIALKNNPLGDAIHAIVEVPELINLLDILREKGILKEIEDNYFNSPFIINSFSVLNNLPNNPNFSSNIHRDIRFFSGECNLMLNCLLMVDDFSIENGATCVFPGSHKEKELTYDGWGRSGIQLEGKAGDVVIWNSNLCHCSMLNITKEGRRAIPFVFSKSMCKQLLDYPRALKDKKDKFSPENQQLLGFNSIVPSSLEEWKGERTYKKNQD